MKPLAPRCAHRVTVIEDFGVSALLMVVPERPQDLGKCCASKRAGGLRREWDDETADQPVSGEPRALILRRRNA